MALNKYMNNYILSKEERPCWVCGKPTKRIEINYEARICSDECEKVLEEEIEKRIKDLLS